MSILTLIYGLVVDATHYLNMAASLSKVSILKVGSLVLGVGAGVGWDTCSIGWATAAWGCIRVITSLTNFS